MSLHKICPATVHHRTCGAYACTLYCDVGCQSEMCGLPPRHDLSLSCRRTTAGSSGFDSQRNRAVSSVIADRFGRHETKAHRTVVWVLRGPCATQAARRRREATKESGKLRKSADLLISRLRGPALRPLAPGGLRYVPLSNRRVGDRMSAVPPASPIDPIWAMRARGADLANDPCLPTSKLTAHRCWGCAASHGAARHGRQDRKGLAGLGAECRQGTPRPPSSPISLRASHHVCALLIRCRGLVPRLIEPSSGYLLRSRTCVPRATRCSSSMARSRRSSASSLSSSSVTQTTKVPGCYAHAAYATAQTRRPTSAT